METALGRYDDALGHLREMSRLAERFDIARLIAAAGVQLGTLAVMQGRLDEAALLEEGLRMSLEMRSGTRNVSPATPRSRQSRQRTQQASLPITVIDYGWPAAVTRDPPYAR